MASRHWKLFCRDSSVVNDMVVVWFRHLSIDIGWSYFLFCENIFRGWRQGSVVDGVASFLPIGYWMRILVIPVVLRRRNAHCILNAGAWKNSI